MMRPYAVRLRPQRLTPTVTMILLGGMTIGASTLANAQRGAEPPLADRIWSAGALSRRLEVAAEITATRPPFDTSYAALRAGPTYRSDVRTGRILARHEIAGRDHPYLLQVPDSYAPGSPYAVRVYLHGGVGRAERPGNGDWWRDPQRLARPDTIDVIPASWAESKWWQASQLQSLRRILESLKSTYDIDENRVHLLGISDGATGIWYVAFQDATPWAGMVPMIGHPAVLSNPRGGIDGQMHIGNLSNRSFLVFSGGVDRLYPARAVRPYMQLFEQERVAVHFVERPDDGHTVAWWPEEAARINDYLDGATRRPLPASLDWATDGLVTRRRLHWLVIDELGGQPNDHVFAPQERAMSGAAGTPVLGFPHPRPFGRVQARADGNEIRVLSQGVRRFRLLLSPERFDLDRPIRVLVNGVERHSGPAPRDVGLLLEYAARDLDRQMLFGAQVEIDLAADDF